MATLESKDVRKLASLARLSLDETEVTLFTEQIGGILHYIDRLREVDVNGVPEWRAPDMPESSLRSDEAQPSLDPEEALSSVPRRRGKLVVAPKFKED